MKNQIQSNAPLFVTIMIISAIAFMLGFYVGAPIYVSLILGVGVVGVFAGIGVSMKTGKGTRTSQVASVGVILMFVVAVFFGWSISFGLSSMLGVI